MKKVFITISLTLGFVIFLNGNHKVFANMRTTEVKEGTYEIFTGVSNTKVINVQSDSKNNGANVNIYEKENKNSQKFKVKLNQDGTYTFTALHSNKVLDVVGAGRKNGTNVDQYQSNGTNAQKWYLESCGNGYYYIVSKCNGLYLDIASGSNKNGANLQVYTGNKTKAQKFKFSKVREIKGQKTIENGTYYIYSEVASNRVLGIPNSATNNNATFKTATLNNRANEKFQITYNQDGTYTIKVLHTKKAMDVPGASGKNGTPIQQYNSNNTAAQKWVIQKNADNTYSIISKCNGLALDIAGGSKSVGASVQTYSYNGSNAQKFTFQACSTEKGTQSAENGTYRMVSTADNAKAFYMANSNKLQMGSNTKAIQQKFEIQYVGDGYYKIKAKSSNKVLTVESKNPKVGNIISQQNDGNLDTQKWILKKYSESVYAIISKCGNLYIDLGSASVNNGQVLKLNTETDLKSQQFILINETPTKNVKQISDGIYQISLKTNRVVDVSGGNYNNGANVQIWENTRVQQQKFRITRIRNTNYYRITAVHSARVLDVQGGNINFGANVNQYASNGTDAQYWFLEDCGDGYYHIISKANGLCLDVASGYTSCNGTNLQLYYKNGTNAQKFKLTPINMIDNNTYEIETNLNPNMVVDVSGGSKAENANVQLWTADNVNQQKFVLTALSSDTYKIIAKHSNKALTATSNNVCQANYTGASNQQWQIKEAGNGYYHIVSKATGKTLDVSSALARNGQNIQIYTSNYSNAQKFRFVKGIRKFYQTGNYGRSGLAVKGDRRGSKLKYYKYGKGSKVLFATFSIHGFEDSYSHDGAELTYIAEEFKKYLDNHMDESITRNWTIYIFPNLNPDGQAYGHTNNGPGRTSLFSAAPATQGVDLNRNWSVGYKREKSARNYNGTAPFQAYEAIDLRNFMLSHQGSTKTITVDTHGWLNETIGDNGLGRYYRNQFGLPTHINSYGSGYLVNWARTLRNARSVLVELPQVSNHSQTVGRNYAQKYINATMQMLREN